MTTLRREDLEPPRPGGHRPGGIEVGASLREALSALLAQDSGALDVHADGELVGVLTPAALHTALRRSVARDDEPADELASEL
nr:hypothetical protein [Frankia alni]